MRIARLAARTALMASVVGGAVPGRAAEDALAKAPSRFAVVDGMRVHYKSLGKGSQALVLVHGWACDLSFWRFQAGPLAAHHRVLLIDLPGHGQSDAPEIAYTPALSARAVDAMLLDAGVTRAVLVGHSNGAPVIRTFARLFPAKTAGLVVVDGNLRPFWQERSQLDAFAGRLRGPKGKEAAAKMIDGMIAATVPEARDWIRATMLRTPQQVMVSSFEETGDPAVWTPDPIPVPLLVVLAKSPFWTEDYRQFVRTLSPTVDYQVLERVSHFLMIDDPRRFNRILERFLGKKHLLAPGRP